LTANHSWWKNEDFKELEEKIGELREKNGKS